ncbi:papain-like cysteine peptidase [Neobacillus mesonae]|nr:papain-like cysteine peptidase [Neobacillus mesonae]
MNKNSQQIAGILKYDAVFSLGSNCQAAHQLRRLSLRLEAGPLDWFVSKDVDQLIRLIDTRFKGLMEQENLEMISTFRTCYCIQDTRYGFLSYHDFPVKEKSEDWTLDYPDFKTKLTRRINRLVQAMDSAEKLLFVRVNAGQDDSERLYHSLRKQIKHSFDLILIDTLADSDAPVKRWVDRSGCIRYSIPKGTDWRGSNEAWNEVGSNVRLRSGLHE